MVWWDSAPQLPKTSPPSGIFYVGEVISLAAEVGTKPLTIDTDTNTDISGANGSDKRDLGHQKRPSQPARLRGWFAYLSLRSLRCLRLRFGTYSTLVWPTGASLVWHQGLPLLATHANTHQITVFEKSRPTPLASDAAEFIALLMATAKSFRFALAAASLVLTPIPRQLTQAESTCSLTRRTDSASPKAHEDGLLLESGDGSPVPQTRVVVDRAISELDLFGRLSFSPDPDKWDSVTRVTVALATNLESLSAYASRWAFRTKRPLA